MGLNIFKDFLINLCKGRMILEGVHIFLENSISPLRLSIVHIKTLLRLSILRHS